MRLIKTVKYHTFTGQTKQEVFRKAAQGSYYEICSFRGYSFTGWCSGKYKYAMNFEKRRKKSKVITSGRNKGKRVVIQDKHWICRLYKFEINFPISIKQNARNFDYTY